MRGHTDPLDCGMLFPPQTEVNVLIFVVLTISLRFSLHASYWTTWRTSWQQTDTKTFPGMKRKVYEDFLGWRRGESPAWAYAHLGLRPLRRGEGLTRSRASRFSSCSSAPFAGSTPHGLHQAQKKPPLRKSEGGFCQRLVEAGGVEPPSEDSLLRATTCVSGHLGLVPGDPGRQGSLRTIPGEGSPFGPPGGGFRLSRKSDLLAPIRAFDGRRQAA